MEKAIKAIASILGIVATLATLVMMISIAIDVAFRILYNRSVPGVLEISETALVTAVFLGLAYTGATNSHIAVDLLTERLKKPVLRWVLTAAWALSTGFLVWLLFATVTRAIPSFLSRETRMGLVAWPIWPSRWIIVIGIFAMLLVAVVNLVRTATGREILGADNEERMTGAPERPWEFVVGDPVEGHSGGYSGAEGSRIANLEGHLTHREKEQK